MSANRQIRWGILSTANIGRKRVVPAMQAARNGRVVAVASRDVARAKSFADELSIPTAYGSYEELIADPNIDAIYNPLPNHMHTEWSIKSAEAGKPVLCEKPLASDAAEAQHMVDTFARLGIPLAEAFMYRFHPQTQRVKKMVDEGAVGDVRLISASFEFNVRDEDDIRLKAEMAGGSMMDVGCYCVSIARMITGEEPHRVTATANYEPNGGVDNIAGGTLHFPSGVIAVFDSGVRSYFTHRYEVRGTSGRIVVDEAFVINPTLPSKIRYWHDDAPGGYEEIEIPAANSYTLMAEDFADALLNNRPPLFPAQDAADAMVVLDNLRAAARR
ncbi:MAG: Gfo/Idh/MocA family oxidoreductase [Burkholderiales bacterium]|nr:Gfo/Idh/MocA family oxidoreductase [Anaerolineae bacterium]